MKSILCGIIAIAIVSLMAWAIAPWFLLLWFARGYHVDVKISPKDITKTVEIVSEPQEEPEVIELELELEDYWQEVVLEKQPVEAELLLEKEPETEVEIKEELPVAEPALEFPPCPSNLDALTTRQLQLLCGEINKVKRGSISGYRTKKDKDKQEIVKKVEAFYQTVRFRA
jgi:hypothetical protein